MASNKTPQVASAEMLNSIRADASDAYKNAVPVATPYNLADVGNPILTYEAVANEFLNALVNKIIMTLVIRKTWANPLAILKKGTEPLGLDVEEIQVNPANATVFDGTTENGYSDILKPALPDVKAAWYRLNRQDKYKVTINNEMLTNAFTSWNTLEGTIAAIVDSLYNGNTIDEFKYTKQLIDDALTGTKLNTVTVTAPTNRDTAAAFQQTIQNLSLQFQFPSTAYNNYTKMGGTGGRTTWSSIEDQIIIINAEVASAVGVQFLAAAFNLSYADYATKQIIVDSFAPSSKCLAILADVNVFQIREKLRRMTNFYNAGNMAWQYYFHCWDTFSLSPFHNAVALVTE